MAQQTAVNWLIEQIESGKIEIVYSNKIHSIKCIPEIKEQAKEMEKQEKKYFFDCGRQYQLTGEGTFTQVYNETYGK